MYKLDKDKLLFDLYIAYECAIKHKRNKPYIKEFEKKLSKNLIDLRDMLWNRTYIPQHSICFIVSHPKKREVFAANFRDRIIHHLYFNYTHKLYENTFIYDSYSCIKGKGTHFGIERFKKHILQESNNYTENCYVLKMDISGYFMHIDRELLNNIALDSIKNMQEHLVVKKDDKKWKDIIDIDFVNYLTTEISTHDPSKNCIFRSNLIEWEDLPKSKSLFYSPKNCGLPIGNLTSQLFSNVYLNKLDQFVKRILGCKHYGRYVDDFYIVSKDKEFLHSIIPKIENFLKTELRLNINKGKTKIINVKYGIEFLGAFIKPNRTYISNACLRRIKKRLNDYEYHPYNINIVNSINSFLGIFSHYRSFNIRKNLFFNMKLTKDIGIFNELFTKFIPYNKLPIV